MADGWIKLYRQSVENGWLQNHKLWAFWSYCLLKASHKKSTIMVGFQRVDLEPGQFIFGRKKASFDLKLSEQEVRTCLKHLENYENITIKSTNKYTLVTLNKWEQFQGEDIADNQQINQHVTSSQPTSNQQVTTNKNDKNYKNEKKEEIVLSDSKESAPSPNVSKAEKLKAEIDGMILALGCAWSDNLEYYRTKYPGRDMVLAIESMKEWIRANPAKAKKRTDWSLFVQNWLRREKPDFSIKPPSQRQYTPTTAELIESEKNHEAEMEKDRAYFRQLDENKRRKDAGEITEDEYYRLNEQLTDEYERTA